MSCQLDFSGLFAEGFGRAIGENAEQLHVSPCHRHIPTHGGACIDLSFYLHCALVSRLAQCFTSECNCSSCPQAYFKPQAKSWRYMAVPHWNDAIEDALALFARKKYMSFAPALVQVRVLQLNRGA